MGAAPAASTLMANGACQPQLAAEESEQPEEEEEEEERASDSEEEEESDGEDEDEDEDASDEKDEAMHIYVRPEVGAAVKMDVKASDTLGHVTSMFFDWHGIPPEHRWRIRILRDDWQELDSDWTLSGSDISHGKTVYFERE